LLAALLAKKGFVSMILRVIFPMNPVARWSAEHWIMALQTFLQLKRWLILQIQNTKTKVKLAASLIQKPRYYSNDLSVPSALFLINFAD
jgi:hypothetical protein